MSSHFVLTIGFLDHRYHGRRDGGEPEWPPSPLRVFQSLIAAAARMNYGTLSSQASAALQWLQQQSAPIILAPSGVSSTSSYRLSVPNNAMDIVAKAWCRGNDTNTGDANPATHRTMKSIRPTHLVGGDTVYYLWPVNDPIPLEVNDYLQLLCDMARNIQVLGWGIDMVVGNSSILTDDEVTDLHGERWLPHAKDGSQGLRVPFKGTLEDLQSRHQGFLARLENNTFTPPPPLTVYDKFNYRRAIDPPRRSVAAFSLLKVDASGFRAFDTVKWALSVAGMTRHAVKFAAQCAGWPNEMINACILGHGGTLGESDQGPRRFAYIPLPSIEGRGEGAPVVGSVRRVMITSFYEDCDDKIDWVRRALSGQVLVKDADNRSEKGPVALLALLQSSDKVIQSYLRPSTTWATVTPVVLPGYDDPAHFRRRIKNGVTAEEQKRLSLNLEQRIDGLLRKAIVQAGFSKVLAQNALIDWRKVGYWRGGDLADRYGVPDHLHRYPRFHVKITWCDEQQRPLSINGPLCIGGGKFYGLGLFAPMPD